MPEAFLFESDSRLPLLSWVARAARNAPVLVRHGAHVETRPDGFVEGAWDGGFDAWDFDRAETLAGTGARARDGRLVFAAPFHPLERLFVLRTDDQLFVSNSLAFLLTEAGDSLDLAYPPYFFDFVRQVRRGVTPPPVELPTANRRRVTLYPACNLELSADLTLRRVSKSGSPPPAAFRNYIDHLLATTERLAANAGSRSRKVPYRLVAACSRGYDSTASSAIARRAGCREGVTFRTSRIRRGHPIFDGSTEPGDDSGREALGALGMTVTEFDRKDLKTLPGFPTAEFFISSPASTTDAAMQLMTPVLSGAVLVSGRHGERYWGPTTRCRRIDFREVDDCLASGQSLGELRLRTGFLHFPLPYVGARHGPAIYRITHSSEMTPWKLGVGYYDRPVARRIAEEAGVPRGSFGTRKLGGNVVDRRMNAESERDFADFVRTSVPQNIRRGLDPRPFAERTRGLRLLMHARTHYAHWPLLGTALDVFGADRLHAMWNSVLLYHFHWGFEKTAARYRR